jgi:polyprenyl-phospho-N-acetylgalactosaminyl synthase
MSTPAFRPCVLIPHYDNPKTLRSVVEGVLAHVPDVIVVDDGSGPEGRAAAEEVVDLADVVFLEPNQGKGAACLAGFARAAELGFTHAVQMDADGQHDVDDLPTFVATAKARPEALVCGVPLFDESAPTGRVIGRKISVFWVDVEVGRGVIRDPLYGFRVYPVAASLDADCQALRMGFDTDIAVRLVWKGVPTVNLATKVTYFPRAEGGVSHFRVVQDNVALFVLHTGLFFRSLWWRLRR